MSEGFFGLVGVLIGGLLTWVQQAWWEQKARTRNAHYLAIRVTCILDKYIEDCVSIVLDDGYCEGRPGGKDGSAEPQVATPIAPSYPEDLDWKSIDHGLMYRVLSLPRDVEMANRAITDSAENAFPPDYEEYFEQRQYQYAKLGLAAFALTEDLRTMFMIPAQELGDWNPAHRLEEEKGKIEERWRARNVHHAKQMESSADTVVNLGSNP